MNTSVIFLLTNSLCCEKTLTKITAELYIEGNRFEQIFEPEANLEVSFNWNRVDVYGQKVFGEVHSIFKVGLDYSDCEHTIWEERAVILEAEDPHLADFSGWNLNLHHRLEPQSGLLYLGDGRKMDLKSEGASLRPGENDYYNILNHYKK